MTVGLQGFVATAGLLAPVFVEDTMGFGLEGLVLLFLLWDECNAVNVF
jgi:hypothetical protein